ncbi:MAG: recombinase family protein [Clostridia bacterium]|nr:recombinase family protein [Clostridia bacterium]
MKAVIYARYSSAGQTEQSIDGQLRVCREYTEHNKIEIVGEYIDRAMTGTNDNRPEFQRMIDDASRKLFDIIIVYKLDRFSRNKYDSVVYKHKLGQYNVRVVSATEAISDTPEGAIMEGLLEMFAEMYSKDLSQKVKRGMKESILKGNYIGGHVLYGYKVVDKKLVIDEETAPAIRYLFEEYATGKSKKQIVAELNAKGYTIRGKKFTYNSLQNNLRNKKYAGIFDNGVLQNDNYYPAIIDKKLFNQVQVMLDTHKHAPAHEKAKVEFLLTGKAFCGHCGAPMVGTSCGKDKHSRVHYYYNCANKIKTHTCNKSFENKEYLEDFVIDETLKYILQPKHIENIADKLIEYWESGTTGKKIKEYEKRIAKIDSELNKCFDLFYKTDNDMMRQRLNEKADSYALQREDLQKELTKVKMAERVARTKDDIIVALGEYLNGNKHDIEYRRKIISKFVNVIYVFDDKVAIYYNLFGTQRVSLEQAKENIAKNEKNSNIRISNETPRHCKGTC